MPNVRENDTLDRPEAVEETPDQKKARRQEEERVNASNSLTAPVPYVTLRDTENDVTMVRHPIDAKEIINAPDNQGKVEVAAGQAHPTTGIVAEIKHHPESPKRRTQAMAEEVIPLAPAVANVLGVAGVEDPGDPESRRKALGDDEEDGGRKASGGRKAGRKAKRAKEEENQDAEPARSNFASQERGSA
jgi:hypothetical protein